jgi:hypothetical protein
MNNQEVIEYFGKLSKELKLTYPVKIDFMENGLYDELMGGCGSLVRTHFENDGIVHLKLQNPDEVGLVHECLELKVAEAGTPLTTLYFSINEELVPNYTMNFILHFVEMYSLTLSDTAQNMFLHPQVYNLYIKHSNKKLLIEDIFTRLVDSGNVDADRFLEKMLVSKKFQQLSSELSIRKLYELNDEAQMFDLATTEIAVERYDLYLKDELIICKKKLIHDSNLYQKMKDHASVFFDMKPKDAVFDNLEPLLDKTFSLLGIEKPFYILAAFKLGKRSVVNHLLPDNRPVHYTAFFAIDEVTKEESRDKKSNLYKREPMKNAKIIKKRDPNT